MHLLARVWSCLSYLTNILTLSAVDQNGSQQPIGGHGISVRPPTQAQINAQLSATAGSIVFQPPGFRPDPYDNSNTFTCQYPSMNASEWEDCSREDQRGCWLRNKRTGEEYNIKTDYEHKAPIGIVRNIFLDISDGTVNADGMAFKFAKLINGSYPGPLIQAVSLSSHFQDCRDAPVLTHCSVGAIHSISLF